MITFDQTDKLDVLPDQLNNRPGATFLENLTAGYDSGKYSGGAGANSDFLTAQEIWGPILDELKTNGLDVKDPTMFLYTSFLSGDFANHSAYRKTATDIFETIRKNKDTLPSELQNLTLDTINERIKAFAINKQQELQDLADVSPGFDKTIARFVGGIGAGAFDPMTAVTAPFGGWSKTLWKNLLQNAAVNAGAGAISEVAVAEWYKEIGLEYTYEDFLTNVAMQGAFGAALPVAGRGVKITYAQMKKGWKVLSESGGNKPPVMEQALADALDEQEVLVSENPLEGPMVAKTKQEAPFLYSDTIKKDVRLGMEFGFQDQVDLGAKGNIGGISVIQDQVGREAAYFDGVDAALSGSDSPPTQVTREQTVIAEFAFAKAKAEADQWASMEPAPPPARRNDIAELEHENRAATAQTAVDNGQLPAMPDMPESPVSPTTLLDAIDNLDGVLFKFDPRDIQVDAKTFQFKAGGDEFGVGERLQGAVWDDSKSGRISVYEYADGSRFIIDGHQRLGLAKRSLSQNPNQKIILYGDLIKEVDGVSVDQARVRAAMKNIAEGSGTAIDAAKVLRVEPSRLSELPPKSDLVRQAQDMMDMPEAAFMAIINRVIPENYGAIVGRVLKDMPELQEAAIAILAKAGPANVFQAEAIVRQVRSAGGEEIKQIDLFGETAFVESFYNERSKVLDETYKQLRKDKAAFENLTRNADRLEAEGNQLAREANEKRATTDAQTISLLQAVANRKGALSDALTNAAKSARSTGNYAAASREFLTDVRRAIESGDFDRVSNGDVGRPLDGAPSTRPNTPEAEPNLEGFDEATGPAAEAQADQLIQDMFGAPVPERAPMAEAIGLDDVNKLIDSGRALISKQPISPLMRKVLSKRDFHADEIRPLFNEDQDYVIDYFTEKAEISLDSPGSLAKAMPKLDSLKKEIFTRTQDLLSSFPDVMTVYRIGQLDRRAGGQLVSFTLNPKYKANLNLPWVKNAGFIGSPDLVPYTVNKSDIIASGDLGPRTFDEHEVLIRPTSVEPISQRAPMAEVVDFKAAEQNLKTRQPVQTVDDIYAIAEESQTYIAGIGDELAQDLGVKFKNPGLKKIATANEKMARKSYTSSNQMTDISRAGFVINKVEDADAIAARFAKDAEILDEGWSVTQEGYFDRKILVRTPNGLISEIQIWSPNLIEAKNAKGHDLYEKMRSSTDKAEIDQLVQDMRQLYAEALAKEDQSFLNLVGMEKAPKVLSNIDLKAASEAMTRPEVKTSAPSTAVQASPGTSKAIASLGENDTAGLPSQSQSVLESSMGITSKDNIDIALNAVKSEMTAIGEQLVIPGAERITPLEMAQRMMDKPMRGSEAPLPEGGLFDDVRTSDLFDDMDMEIPIGETIDPVTNERVASTITMRDLKTQIDMEDSLIQRLGFCTT
jgi:hypothetical protein